MAIRGLIKNLNSKYGLFFHLRNSEMENKAALLGYTNI